MNNLPPFRKITLNQTSDLFWELEDYITNVVNFVNENDRMDSGCIV